jgi:hypothetical protein
MDSSKNLVETYSIQEWFEINKNALEYLYYQLLEISSYHGIKIIVDEISKNNFISMMYNESNGDVIDEKLFPEFF